MIKLLLLFFIVVSSFSLELIILEDNKEYKVITNIQIYDLSTLNET